MPRPFPLPTILGRDGTSQRARVHHALDPASVAVDERTPRDWLAFVRDFARTLRFADPERPAADLDWRALLDDDVDLERAAAYLDDPAAASPAETERFGRPHFALLLAFLHLVRVARDHTNALTRRHLEHYYEQVLRMQRRAPTPDQVSVVLRPAAGVSAFLLPAGTELAAGKSASGAALVYRTDRDVVVDRAQVAELRSVYIDQRVTGLREANERRDPGLDRKDRFVRMFQYALGEPRPGDPLPPYAGEPVTLDTLVRLGELARFAPERLHMELFEFRSMITLAERRAAADAEWVEIDRLLEQAGRRRTGDPAWQLAPTDPRDFDANLARALGAPADADYFAGLPEVDDIDDLYKQRLLEQDDPETADDSDVAEFIRAHLYFPDLADFDAMMALKTAGDGEWKQVDRILERAGQRRRGDRSWRLDPADPTDFAANFAAALVGPGFAWPPGVTGPESYHAAIRALEAYFFMSAESLAYVTAAAPVDVAEPTPKQWERIYAMLTAAYQARVYAGRRAALAGLRAQSGMNAMLYAALGAEPSASDESPLPQLRPHVVRAADYDVLEGVAAAVAAAGGDESAVDAARWARVVDIVELAQRVREQLPEPVPLRVEWRNLYPYRDATTVAVTAGLSSDAELARWQTFGARPVESADAPPATAFGWAIASPMLALSEGERTVVLTLGFVADGWRADELAAAVAAGALVVEATTAKGWISPSSITVAQGDYAALGGVARDLVTPLKAVRLTLGFAVDVGPLAALAPKDSGIAATDPALRLAMRQIWDPAAAQWVTLYEPFKPLELAAVHLRVEVAGLASLALQNDHGAIDPRRPFEPFGPAPAAGSRLLIGHAELVRSRLDSLVFRVEWMGAPGDLAGLYANYGLGAITNESFTARITAVDHRRSFELRAAAPLFAAADARLPRDIAVLALPAALGRDEFVARADLLDWRRYLQWELTPLDLQHGAYARVAGQKAVELSTALSAGQQVSAAQYQVGPPYTPKIKRLTVDYKTSVEVVLDDPAALAGPEQLFHVRPFGSHRIVREDGAAGYRFLPAYDDGGELYIGLSGVAAPQRLTLLLQLAEGSADPDLPPAPVEWSYLAGDRWRTLHDGDVLRDTTRGLINSGILELSLPAAAPSTQLPADRYWLRASVPYRTDSVCDVVAIRAQAVTATFVDAGDAPEHYDQPLPAGTIRGLVRHEPRLGGVEQPYTSFGGRPRERAEDFYTRVSERLRHKQRALTLWDYERLVLERFPQVYKVKCLPADLGERPDDPGRVELVVIPDIRGKLPFDPFEPKAPADLLADVERHIAPRCPPFAAVRARNARFVAVKTRFGVRFRPGRDPGFHLKLLSEELCRFLSPWAYDEAADVAIGGRIYASSVVNFVDSREYVDYVATIKLFRSLNGRDFELVPPPTGDDAEGYSVGTVRADEVLVSARQHEIDLIHEVAYRPELLSGINYMKVELDFVVG
jgi:hypothetical protein